MGATGCYLNEVILPASLKIFLVFLQ